MRRQEVSNMKGQKNDRPVPRAWINWEFWKSNFGKCKTGGFVLVKFERETSHNKMNECGGCKQQIGGIIMIQLTEFKDSCHWVGYSSSKLINVIEKLALLNDLTRRVLSQKL